jgi:hypothetical protein
MTDSLINFAILFDTASLASFNFPSYSPSRFHTDYTQGNY